MDEWHHDPVVTSGNPEVVVRAKNGMLFFPSDMPVFEKITDEDVQMCVEVAPSVVCQPRLVVVRSASGAWKAAYQRTSTWRRPAVCSARTDGTNRPARATIPRRAGPGCGRT
jgi:hypothetical protein